MNSSDQRLLFSDEDSTSPSGKDDLNSKNLYLPTDEQRLLIRASAGTGKTFQLANRYLTLLRNSSTDKILASTFTRKAAGEITERILLRLAKAALEQKSFEDLQKFTGKPEITQCECLDLIKEFTSQLHRTRISTLDGFFARLAGSFALELRLPPGWRLIDELEANHLRDQAIDQVLREGNLQELKSLMHQLDKGSVRRSVHQLIAEHIDAFHGIYLRTDEQAWNSFGKIKLPTNEQLEIITQEIAELPIENSRMEKARQGDLKRLENEEWDSLYKNGLLPKILGDGKYYKIDIPENVKEKYLHLEKLLKGKFLAPWANQTSATYQLLKHFDEVYEQLKRETSGLRFDDVTRRLAQSLSTRSTSELTHRLDGSIDHILLDEFQDTSVNQWSVIRPFAEDATTNAEKSFFCVGDGKQAIYSWRGGEASIFDTITTQLEGIQEQPLNKSYRSSQVVIDIVNNIFNGLTAHNGFDEEFAAIQTWSDHFPNHETALKDLPGYFRLCTSPVPNGIEPGERDQNGLADEANRYIAKMIQDQIQQHPQGTIGVLTRRNQRISELIFELNQLGIDASEEGGNPLTDSAGVLLLLALFKLADHPGDTISRFHISESPLANLLNFPNPDNDQAIHLFALDFRKRLLRHGYGSVLNDLVEKLAPSCSRRELRRLTQLAALADDFDMIAQSTRTSEFIEFVENQRVLEPTDSRVRVMTVHQSKGLQFDTVIFAECDGLLTRSPQYLSFTPSPGAPPEVVAHYRSKEFRELFPPKVQQALDQTTDKQITEAMCLLYVAITRAIHSLIVVVLPRTAKTPEKRLPKTAAGLFRAALAPNAALESNITLYEQGDSQWFTKLKTDKLLKTEKAPEALSLEIKFKTSTGQRRLPRITPSRHEHTKQIRLENLLPTGDPVAFLRGTLFHAWLERIEWFDGDLPRDSEFLTIGSRLGVQPAKLENWMREFHELIKKPFLSKILSRKEYVSALNHTFQANDDHEAFSMTVQNERSFAVLDNNNLLNGTIDRFVMVKKDQEIIAADIIDYKTDALRNDLLAINDCVEVYRPQLETYRHAIASIYKLAPERISARLVLLSPGRIIDV